MVQPGNIQSLLDRASIQDVHTQYFQGLDQQNGDKVRACFDKDVELVYDKLPSVRGVDAFMRDIIGPFFESTKADNERYGRVSRVNPETGEVRPMLTIAEVLQTGESGLLGMALHPGFADTPQVFLAYTYRGTSGQTPLMRCSKR